MAATAETPTDVMLEIRDLEIAFGSGRNRRNVVHGIGLRVGAGERIGILGESGSGKSVTALSVMGLLDNRVASYGTRSSITFDGRELLGLRGRALRQLRGADIAMVFQDPTTSLNPVFTIGDQLVDVLRTHKRLSKKAAKAAALTALKSVEIRDPRRVFGSYPHELSGGMRQRVLIAMAVACEPRLLIADEPTSALDVTVQAIVLDLLDELISDHGMSLVLISHDIGVIARLCTYGYVMNAGYVVEEGPTAALLREPQHPYTKALLESIPRIDEPRRTWGRAATMCCPEGGLA